MRVIRIKPEALKTPPFCQNVIAYGAGRQLFNNIRAYDLFKKISFLCDSNHLKWGQTVTIFNQQDQACHLSIISINEMKRYLTEQANQYVLLVCSMYGKEIIRLLQKINLPNGVICYHVSCCSYTRKYLYTKVKTKNIFIRDLAFRAIFLPERRAERRYVQMFSQNKKQSMLNGKRFQELIVENITLILSEGFINHESRAVQSYAYGAIDALYAYASLPARDRIYFPEMEHGANGLYAEGTPDSSYILMGKNLNDVTRQYTPDALIFNVGPYIHYARCILSEEEIQITKKKNGKTLLFFLSHSLEGSATIFSQENLLEQLRNTKLSYQFDTVMVSVYWWDFHLDFINTLRNEGYQIVTAGLRIDPCFLPRVKTLLMLSDCVAVNAYCTAIAYATYFQKPVAWLQQNIQIIHDSNIQEFIDGLKSEDLANMMEDEFLNAYSKNPFEITQDKIDLCEKYYGFSQVKTPREIAAISKICKKIWWKSRGNPDTFCDYAKCLLQELEIKKDENSKFLLNVLRESLSN